jgi:hypothetical protein
MYDSILSISGQDSGRKHRTRASIRSPEIPEPADLYGWLCGSWDLDVRCYRGINVADRGTFTEITAHSFRWRGEALYPNASTWTLEAGFLATRR